MTAVAVIFLPAGSTGPLCAVDARALAFSNTLVRLLARTGHTVEWLRVADDTLVAGLPDRLMPLSSGTGIRRQPAGEEQIELVYDAAYYTPEAAARAIGMAHLEPCKRRRSAAWPSQVSAGSDITGKSSEGRLVHYPLQPIRWSDDRLVGFERRTGAHCRAANETSAGSPAIVAESLRSMPLADLCDAFGETNLAWWCVSRSPSHLLSLRPAQIRAASLTNPLYNVQYALARIGSVLRESSRCRWSAEPAVRVEILPGLQAPEELRLSALLGKWPAVIERATGLREPHRIISYLRDLANALHIYYRMNNVHVDEPRLRQARVSLLLATQGVLTDGLALFGINTPEVL